MSRQECDNFMGNRPEGLCSPGKINGDASVSITSIFSPRVMAVPLTGSIDLFNNCIACSSISVQ